MEESVKKRMYRYVWLGHYAVQNKLTQYLINYTLIKKKMRKKTDTAKSLKRHNNSI